MVSVVPRRETLGGATWLSHPLTAWRPSSGRRSTPLVVHGPTINTHVRHRFQHRPHLQYVAASIRRSASRHGLAFSASTYSLTRLHEPDAPMEVQTPFTLGAITGQCLNDSAKRFSRILGRLVGEMAPDSLPTWPFLPHTHHLHHLLLLFLMQNLTATIMPTSQPAPKNNMPSASSKQEPQAQRPQTPDSPQNAARHVDLTAPPMTPPSQTRHATPKTPPSPPRPKRNRALSELQDPCPRQNAIRNVRRRLFVDKANEGQGRVDKVPPVDLAREDNPTGLEEQRLAFDYNQAITRHLEMIAWLRVPVKHGSVKNDRI
ncbi:hypothetical protein IWX48DRAFT_595963 [Phyllosticta citricarpa]